VRTWRAASDARLLDGHDRARPRRRAGKAAGSGLADGAEWASSAGSAGAEDELDSSARAVGSVHARRAVRVRRRQGRPTGTDCARIYRVRLGDHHDRLWLMELHGLDIRCVRLTPCRVGDRLLLDVQQVIPLPEASELTIQLPAEGNAGTRGTRCRWPRLGPVRDHGPSRRERAGPQEAGHPGHGHHAAGRWRASY
jgi:hypothetical protein